MAIAGTGLSDVMSLSPLFDQLLKMGLLFRLVKGAGAVESARLVKVCKRRETLLIDKYDPANQCLSEEVQNHFESYFEHAEYELTTSFPIVINGKMWGCLPPVAPMKLAIVAIIIWHSCVIWICRFNF